MFPFQCIFYIKCSVTCLYISYCLRFTTNSHFKKRKIEQLTNSICKMHPSFIGVHKIHGYRNVLHLNVHILIIHRRKIQKSNQSWSQNEIPRKGIQYRMVSLTLHTYIIDKISIHHVAHYVCKQTNNGTAWLQNY